MGTNGGVGDSPPKLTVTRFAQVVKETRGGRMAFARRWTNDWQTAEEWVAQSECKVFIHCFVYPGDTEIRNPRAYLYKTLWHLITKHHKKTTKRREVSLEESLASDPQELPDDRIELVRRGLRQLPSKYYTVLRLKMDGLTIKEIGRVLSEPDGTVGRWLHEARRLLKSIIEQMLRREDEGQAGCSTGA